MGKKYQRRDTIQTVTLFMKKRYLLSIGLIVLLLVVSPLPAFPVQLFRSGQTTSYYTGDDGDIQAGVAWPSPRFTVNADTTITDKLTGLAWVRDGNIMPYRDPGWDTDGNDDGMVKWEHALDYVAKLNVENYLGHNDWRLPNVNEIVSLFDFSQYGPPLPTGHPFINIQTDNYVDTSYWSSTTNSRSPSSYAWKVDMFEGTLDVTFKTYGKYVWPIRGPDSPGVISLPKTGQTISYYTGDDGDIQAGVAWPSPRFMVNADTTLTDELTGLAWAPNAGTPYIGGECPSGKKAWNGALEYVACLNSVNYLGHDDWRLPNVIEFRTLTHHGEAYNTSWLTAQGFTNVWADFYWTSNTYPELTDYAWWLHMYYGATSGYGKKTVYYYVWPVRGALHAVDDFPADDFPWEIFYPAFIKRKP